MTMNAAIYARVSTKDQSCELQLSDLRKMADARGFEIAEEYVDWGVSGRKEQRPELNRLIADAKRGRFDAGEPCNSRTTNSLPTVFCDGTERPSLRFIEES